MRSETKEIHLQAGTSVVPIDLVFSRLTTMYKLENGTFQRKTAQIRLLSINDTPVGQEASGPVDNSVSPETQMTLSPSRRTAKIIAEVTVDLA